MDDHIREISIDILKEDIKHKHEIELKRFDEEVKQNTNHWESCCLRVDKNMFQYITSMSVIGSCIIGSVVGLILTPHTTVFISLLSLSVGAILPNPKLMDDKK
jgi:hypothetical protein